MGGIAALLQVAVLAASCGGRSAAGGGAAGGGQGGTTGTGGATAGVGGSAAGVGGNAAGVGGSAAGVGGSAAGMGGSATGMGGSAAGVGAGGTIGAGGAGGASSCAVPAISGNLVRDWDVHLVTVSGVITSGGAALPDSPGAGARGDVYFQERITGDYRGMSVGETGAGTFSGMMFAGTYDVWFVPRAVALPNFPSGAVALLARNVTIAGTATVAYDLPPLATISGTVTLAGAPLPLPDDPAAGFRRTVFFRDLRSDRVLSFGVGGPSGPGTFTATLFAGNYDVTFENLTNAPDSVPQGQSRLATNVAIAGDRTMVFDAPLATVSGRVTLGGAQLPNSPGLASRGTVILRETISGVTHELPIAGNGPGAFSGTIFAGGYTVTFKTDAGEGLRGLPIAAERRLASGIEIAGNRSLDYDVSVVKVSGTVTLGGAALADAGAARGAVVLDDKRTGSSHSLAVTETGPATFSGLVFTGTYDVSYRTSSDGALGGLPQNASTLVASDLVVTRDATLAPNLETATVSGVITVGGAALSDSVYGGGTLVLMGSRGLVSYSFPVGKTGPGQFSGTVFAGTYAIGFFTTQMTTLQGLPANAKTMLADAMTLTGRPTLAFDLKLVQVSGTVTVDGAMMPDTSGINRGEVVLHDKLTQDLRRFPVGSLGPARFSGTVFAGNYDVAFETGPGYLTGLPVQAKTDIAQGCLSARPCTASAADLTGRWELTARQGTAPATIEITQSGSELRGSFVSFDATIPLTGLRSGDGIEFRLAEPVGGCYMGLTATVTAGCSMSGLIRYADGACGESGFGTSRFDAFR